MAVFSYLGIEMIAVVRIITLYIISFLLTQGFIPADLARELQASQEAMQALELGVATVITVVAYAAGCWIKKMWTEIQAWLDDDVRFK